MNKMGYHVVNNSISVLVMTPKRKVLLRLPMIRPNVKKALAFTNDLNEIRR